MESIKTTLTELNEHFNSTMAQFQKDLRAVVPATSPTSNVNAQFQTFRTFVLNALESLQLQVELLSRQYDDMDARSRRKILLVHGVAESKEEDTAVCASKILSNNLNLPEVTANAFSRCHRLGRLTSGKSRAILIKVYDVTLRNKIWFAKTALKGSGITVSEFLTKNRHDVFVAARLRFGVTHCWTKNGVITILGSNNRKHYITTRSELDAIPSASAVVPSTVKNTTVSVVENKISTLRSKRTVKNK